MVALFWNNMSVFIQVHTCSVVQAFSDSLRLEVAPFNVSVSLIEPGFVQSAISVNG